MVNVYLLMSNFMLFQEPKFISKEIVQSSEQEQNK